MVRTYLKAVYFVSEEVHDLVASTGFAVLTPRESVNPELLAFIAQSSSFVGRVIRSSVWRSQDPAISEGKLGALHVALPNDVVEQRDMVNLIRDRTAAIDEAIAKAQREADLIRKYFEGIANAAL